MDIKRMHCMIEKIAECAESEFNKGIENVDPVEMGQVTDMLKDLAEAMYYRTLTKAMDESETDEIMEMFDRYGDGGRRFYDNYRYANGRFAPKGRGTRRGYEEMPYWHMTPEMYHDWTDGRDMDRDRIQCFPSCDVLLCSFFQPFPPVIISATGRIVADALAGVSTIP